MSVWGQANNPAMFSKLILSLSTRLRPTYTSDDP